MKITLEDLEKEKDPKKLAEEAERAKQQAERDRNWEDTKSIKQKISQEWKKFCGMDRKEKLAYFRSYYLLPCILVIAAAIFVGTMIRDVIRGQGEVLISGMYLNTSVTAEGEEYLEKGFVDFLGRTGEKVHVNSVQYTMNYDNEAAMAASYQMQMAIVTQLAAGSLDYVLADESAFLYLGKQGMMLSPKEVLTEETYEKYKDRLVQREVMRYVPPENPADVSETEEEVLVPAQAEAFSMAGTKLGEEYLNWPESGDQAYLVLVSKPADAERVGRFLDYIFEG